MLFWYFSKTPTRCNKKTVYNVCYIASNSFIGRCIFIFILISIHQFRFKFIEWLIGCIVYLSKPNEIKIDYLEEP